MERGRPKKEKIDIKTFVLRATKEEMEQIRTDALSNRQNMNQYILSKLLKKSEG